METILEIPEQEESTLLPKSKSNPDAREKKPPKRAKVKSTRGCNCKDQR